MKGSIVAIVTPMLKNGDIDFASLENLLDFHADAGTDGIVLVGTTGESATLNKKVTKVTNHKIVTKLFNKNQCITASNV